MRYLISGGGTAGHLYPAIALAGAIREQDPGANVVFVGSSHGIEASLLPEREEDVRLLSVRGMPRRSPIAMAGFIFRLVASFLKAISIVRREDPDAVIGVGGYASFPALAAGILLRRPTVIHEQNSVPGVVNRRLGRRVTLVALSFKASRRAFKRDTGVIVTGNPLRDGVLRPVTRTEAADTIGIDASRFTLLVFGGSRGARRLTLAAIESAPTLTSRGVQLVIVTGKDDYELACESLEKLKSLVEVDAESIESNVRLIPWWDAMEELYASADVILARAGAGSISELCAIGRASILVPYPHAADDHQARNAEIMVAEGASRLLPDAELSADSVVREVSAFQQDRAALSVATAAARELGCPDAADELASAVVQLAKDHESRRRIGARR